MTRLPPPCPGYDEDLSAFLDGALPLAREDEVRAHLDVCDACVRRLEAFALADAAVAATHVPPASRPRVVARRRRRWLGVAAGAAGALAAGLAALLVARPEGALRSPTSESPTSKSSATLADRAAPLAPPGATSKTPASEPEPSPPEASGESDDRLATASDDELDLVDEIETIEDLELIENLELVERLAARSRS